MASVSGIVNVRYPQWVGAMISLTQQISPRLFTFTTLCQNLPLTRTHVVPLNRAPSCFFPFYITPFVCPLSINGGTSNDRDRAGDG